MTFLRSSSTFIKTIQLTKYIYTNVYLYKCSLTWYVVALYTATIFKFFTERLCSGLWSGCFRVFPPLLSPMFLPSAV